MLGRHGQYWQQCPWDNLGQLPHPQPSSTSRQLGCHFLGAGPGQWQHQQLIVWFTWLLLLQWLSQGWRRGQGQKYWHKQVKSDVTPVSLNSIIQQTLVTSKVFWIRWNFISACRTCSCTQVQRPASRVPCPPCSQPAIWGSSSFLFWAGQDSSNQSWRKLIYIHFHTAVSQWGPPGAPQKPAPLCLWDRPICSRPPQLCLTQLAVQDLLVPRVLDHWWALT